jgi:hypothetical protein
MVSAIAEPNTACTSVTHGGRSREWGVEGGRGKGAGQPPPQRGGGELVSGPWAAASVSTSRRLGQLWAAWARWVASWGQ